MTTQQSFTVIESNHGEHQKRYPQNPSSYQPALRPVWTVLTVGQVELDNTAEEFRRLHAERQDLVRQWQNAVDGMRSRDDEINTVGEKYATARQVRVQQLETLSQNAARLKMQKNDNQEVRTERSRGSRVLAARARLFGVSVNVSTLLLDADFCRTTARRQPRRSHYICSFAQTVVSYPPATKISSVKTTRHIQFATPQSQAHVTVLK